MKSAEAIGFRRAVASPPLRWVARVQVALLILGTLAIGYAAFVLTDAAIYQRAAKRQFEISAAHWGTNPATNAPDANREGAFSTSLPAIPEGAAFARLEIKRLNLDAIVVEGDQDEDLKQAIGHIPTTALPGDPGNVGLAGHRDTFFRPLRNIRKGDAIILASSRGRHQYEVESTEIVSPQDSYVLRPTPLPSLTLVTCYPFYYVGSAPKRFIVHAREVTLP